MKLNEKIENKKNRTSIFVAVISASALIVVAIINFFFHNLSSSITNSEIKDNLNSPIARDIHTQNNNYYYSTDSSKVNSSPIFQSTHHLSVIDNKDEIEISIQLKNDSKGYKAIKVDGKEAKILPNSTPLNPRLLIDSKPRTLQTILINTKNGDTCILERIFDKKDSKNYPIRFIPEYKNEKND